MLFTKNQNLVYIGNILPMEKHAEENYADENYAILKLVAWKYGQELCNGRKIPLKIYDHLVLQILRVVLVDQKVITISMRAPENQE